ncbi:MAG: hypothetical protein AB7E70_19685 [Hyphomicrobiaceae bacterium]
MTKSKGPQFGKLDGGFFNNVKIRRAGRNGREVFLHVLCCNTRRGGHGAVPIGDIEIWYIADQLKISESEAEDGVTKAVTAKLLRITGDDVEIVGWDEDWAWRPQTRAEIQKNYRERKTARSQRYDNDVTSYQQSNALPEEERREEEREGALRADSLSGEPREPSEPEQIRPTDPAAGDSAPVPRAHAARRSGAVDLAAWNPSPDMTRLAANLGCDLKHELANFRAYARERSNAYKSADSADAAFERFMRNSRDKGKKPPLVAKDKPRRVKLLDGTWVERDS